MPITLSAKCNASASKQTDFLGQKPPYFKRRNYPGACEIFLEYSLK